MSDRATFTPTQPHPVLQLPTPDEALAMGQEAWLQAMALREQLIAAERDEPLWHAWEPPIWRVCDALLGFDWVPEAEADAIRRNLGFTQPVSVLLINGAQRGSKTEYAANRMSRLMAKKPSGLSWFFHNTLPSSRESQQPLIWKYLPAQLRAKEVRSQTTYIAYKAKTGFSEENFVLPNLHRGRFLSYDIDIADLQGSNLDAFWADELIDPERVQTLKARIAAKNGVGIITFAPIDGYTPTVQGFWEGAEVVRKCTAFLNPKDGGERDVARYLGLSQAEFEAMREWLGRKLKPPFPNVPWSRPEDCAKWLTGEPSQPRPAPGRVFKDVPRVVKPADPEGKSAIVCFYGNDNPYGNPLSLYLLNPKVDEEFGNRIFYGFAKRGMARKFPLFAREVHVMPAAQIPAQGANYLIVDPADGRNFFMLWVRASGRNAYVYREWPNQVHEVPGHGVLGPWAVPHGRLGDGAPGPGQESLGFGLVDYKREIARLEGWTDAAQPRPREQSGEEWVKGWTPENGARERVIRRLIDSRFASAPHLENDRPVTMLENFADLGLVFDPTPGDDVSEGVQGINDGLRFDTDRPRDALNCPRLYISAECRNLIFALETWRNAEGRKGATKDPIDCLRYYVLSGATDVRDEDYETTGGGHY